MAAGILVARVSDCGLMEKKKSQPDGLALVMERFILFADELFDHYGICGFDSDEIDA
jgi:hypothetical protein